MNTGGRLIAGSHNRNEFVLINADESARVRITSSIQFSFFTLFLGSRWNFFDLRFLKLEVSGE